MRGNVHILVNCPIDTFLKEKQHSAMCIVHLEVENLFYLDLPTKD